MQDAIIGRLQQNHILSKNVRSSYPQNDEGNQLKSKNHKRGLLRKCKSESCKAKQLRVLQEQFQALLRKLERLLFVVCNLKHQCQSLLPAVPAALPETPTVALRPAPTQHSCHPMPQGLNCARRMNINYFIVFIHSFTCLCRNISPSQTTVYFVLVCK